MTKKFVLFDFFFEFFRFLPNSSETLEQSKTSIASQLFARIQRSLTASELFEDSQIPAEAAEEKVEF